MVEIMCAMANVPLVCPFHEMPHPGLTPRRDLHFLRFDFFAELYSTHQLRLPLIDFSQRAMRTALQPPDSLQALWNLLMENLPTKSSAIKSLLKGRAERILHDVSGSNYCSEQLDYKRATWTHDYPDHRAEALVSAHYVLLLQLCTKRTPSGRAELFVQAVVHPSERNQLFHYSRISVWQTLRDEPFSLRSARCSCEDGCVPCFSMPRTTNRHKTRADGLCSHTQALLLTLQAAKQQRTPIVRAPCTMFAHTTHIGLGFAAAEHEC